VTQVTPALVRIILECYRLEWDGVRGVGHWARVRENGRYLAGMTGADLEIVELFAVFHDAARWTDGKDPGHGSRGATLAINLCGSAFALEAPRLSRLQLACSRHMDKALSPDVSVQTCWDADRLDVGRVGLQVDLALLGTAPARRPDVIAWAESRARYNFVPALVRGEWGLPA
jgi:uncharacterized protein